MNPIAIAKIAGIVIAILAIFYTGQRYERSSWLQKEVETQQKLAEQVKAANDKSKAIADSFEAYKATQEKFKASTQRELNNEIKTNSKQYACTVPDGGLRLINASISQANGTSKPN